jgi:hypothetical protein
MKNKLFFKKLLTSCLLCTATILYAQNKNPNMVTYNFSGGRFGDNLVAYVHAKWISHLYKIPFLYKPFPFSNQLKMHYCENLYDEKSMHQKYKKISFNSKIKLKSDHNSLLYVIPYFPESLQEYENKHSFLLYFKINWSDQNFINELRSLISPIKDIHLIKPPHNKISVAVHVRKGTIKIDTSYWLAKLPFKFPPDSFYIDAIKKIYTMCGSQPLFVYIFTDSASPNVIKNKFENAVSCPDIEFSCRNTNSDNNMLTDFFSMLQFDCLIRPESNYSIIASHLGHFKIILSPISLIKDNDKVKIDKILIEQFL